MTTIDFTVVPSRPANPHFGLLPTISLGELNDAAALQRRVDRKYVLTAPELMELSNQLSARLAILEIEGQQDFGYESVYFDTADLRSFLGAARSRRHRFKVRTRHYVDSGDAMLEVKLRDGRGTTIKRRRSHSVLQVDRLDAAAIDFVDTEIGQPGLGDQLRPVLTTSYRRTTMVDLEDVARVTIDADLRFRRPGEGQVGLNRCFVVETKSPGRPSFIDRSLWRLGVRPCKFSKYGIGMAVLDPTLASNKWHRTIARHFDSATPDHRSS